MEREKLLRELGAKIRLIRIEQKMTQKKLAHHIGKDQQSIQRLEAGNINPSYLYLLEISEGLEIPISQLLTR